MGTPLPPALFTMQALGGQGGLNLISDLDIANLWHVHGWLSSYYWCNKCQFYLAWQQSQSSLHTQNHTNILILIYSFYYFFILRSYTLTHLLTLTYWTSHTDTLIITSLYSQTHSHTSTSFYFGQLVPYGNNLLVSFALAWLNNYQMSFVLVCYQIQ